MVTTDYKIFSFDAKFYLNHLNNCNNCGEFGNTYHMNSKSFILKIINIATTWGSVLEDEVIEIGEVINYFSKVNVAVIELSLPLSVGDRILIKGPSTDFEQIVDSIQVDRKNIQRAEGGTSVGLKLTQLARRKDAIYKKL
jgi:hypothetical protein